MKDEKTGPERLNALSDGVIAIALTLLVLGIDIPDDHDFNQDGLLAFLIKLEPALIAYVTSFLIVAIYWIIHHRIFNVVSFVNRTIIVLNIIFLFSISLIPFISKLKSLYRYDFFVVGIFAMAHIITGITLFFIWNYLTANNEYLKFPVDRNMKRNIAYKILVIPIISAIAIPVAAFNIHLGTYIFIFIPVIYGIIFRNKNQS
ncbi:TMEM175 family protein [Fulvivirga sedimenti]|uniref:DUF1211 domain-containing protein n=1 Tax=Fulvivirga sedimenti TaxID=2879465 RepID=A0A9X1HNK9_9BACT|nr:TMEM175 family protein [Fulvivirga sedimenti]MCA6074891.1 DUF1211 domain-containing protein [Fulvivirga sedimenti]MCA6076068.1 DUF1211 domain-containing protein [Fulvivirga sedimenti]MCA6077196.1 DUF1211 domain-containing protein [Fulvivirga sedimenti]